MKSQKIKDIIYDLSNIEVDSSLVNSIVEASIMGDYKFNTYLSKKDLEDEISINLLFDKKVDTSRFDEEISDSLIISKATILARSLVNEPSNILTPNILSNRIVNYGNTYGFDVEVLGIKEIIELKMEAFLSVAKGSTLEPKLIIMRYKGDPKDTDVIGLVGKGLTYDSGGLSIKPTNSMVNMKSDMAGAAAVIGAMCAISEKKLKKNVTSVIAACENMISGACYRPGDIINSMAGKSIYIGNTDAEGRLTLVDAINYIITKEKVSKILDIATLTGAAIHCTGDIAAPAISNNDEFYKKLENSYELSGELIWRMPIFDEYKELIKHEEADLTNTAGSPGTITAGLFIGEFVNNLPWIHVDIAGPSMSDKEKGILSKGATGCGVKPLYYLVKNS